VALAPGTRLGPYEITALIGVGGMGEVYRAADTNLKRQVAIKVLPEAVAQDVDRLTRFRREAEVLATLNHPNIAAIYGLERADGQTALVMELVDGPTVADRIEQGAIPLDEALPLAKQIAEALGAAHGRGIVHRDLKPANIKIRPDGTVKVLDFGLAKAIEPEVASSAGVSQLPTITTPAMTQMGLILGTAAYMSPEQARGKAVDERADIWAFGCVLYEMLTGRRIFQGEDVTDVLVAVLSKDPDWSALPASTPPAIRRLLRRSLERDVRRRQADIADAGLEIEDALTRPGADVVSASPSRVALWRRLALPGCIGVVAAAIAGLVAWTVKPVVATHPVTRFAIALSDEEEFVTAQAIRKLVAVSPDGSRIAYSANGRLYLRQRDQLDAVALAGNGGMPFFSRDGQWLGFWEDGLKSVSVDGGATVPIATTPSVSSATWEPGDTILYSLGAAGIWRVSAAGGKPEQVIKLDEGQRAHGPQLLSGGRAILFTLAQADQSWDDAQIVVHSLDSGSRRVVAAGGTDARYLPTGHLVYARQGTLLAMPFDEETHTATGRPVPVVDDVAQSLGGFSGAAHFSVSDDGTLVYVTSSSLGLNSTSFVWVDSAGRETAVPASPGVYLAPVLSHDGEHVAFMRATRDNIDVWTYEFRRGILQPLTSDPGRDSDPIWSPDGARIAYFSTAREGGPGIFIRAADGTGDVERLTTGTHIPNSWSPDGMRLVYSEFNSPIISPSSPADLGMVVLTGDRRAEKLLVTPVRENNAVISPDGRWLAYESSETNEKDVWVRPFPDVSKARQRISDAGGVSPVWAKDGRTLFYRKGKTIMSVAVRGATPAEWGAPEKLFDGSFYIVEGPTMFDVAPDGRFLMLKDSGGNARATGPKRLIVVENWHEELKRLVPTN
jgi:Tol biopolymer transport system component